MGAGFAAAMMGLAPQGWWRLGEPRGSRVNDSSAYDIAGAYHGAPSFGQPGAIAGDPDTAVAFTPDAYVEVPDHDNYSLAKANDSFARWQENGWGRADHGGAWTPEVSDEIYFSCDGSVARIDETYRAASWMIGLEGCQPYNADIQIAVAWSDAARGGSLEPCSLVARRLDNQNFYRAELVETAAHEIQLVLMKTIGGVNTVLAVARDLGAYTPGATWHVRFQIEHGELRARTWLAGTLQPTTWQVTATDASIQTAGNIAVRSTNSDSEARPIVSFSRFWVQSLGLTVHAWLRLDETIFPGQSEAPYVHWLGKGGIDQQEWAMRIYSQDSPSHTGWVSFYTFSLDGGWGAGAEYHADTLGPLVAGVWYQFVGVLDSGDALDTQAGVSLYMNGQPVMVPPDPGTRYYNYSVVPGNGSAPVRFATRDFQSFLRGALDEVAIFERKLTAEEIANLYAAAL